MIYQYSNMLKIRLRLCISLKDWLSHENLSMHGQNYIIVIVAF